MSTFISVGNAKQSFLRFFQIIDAVVELLPQPIYVQSGHNEYKNSQCLIKAFMDMKEFEQRISACEILIIHAGAGSIINAIQAGKTPIVIPRLQQYGEHIDNHQLEFANRLVIQNGIFCVQNVDEMKSTLQQLKKTGPKDCKKLKHSKAGEFLHERLKLYDKQLQQKRNAN